MSSVESDAEGSGGEYAFLVLTLFPELFPGPLASGVTGRGMDAGAFSVETVGIREFGLGRHRVTDDAPYGGGAGMVMKPEPLVAAIEEGRSVAPAGAQVVLLTPQGRPLTQPLVRRLSRLPGLILVCGRYEGVDERVRCYADLEISVGDFVLSGGEVGAMAVIDAVSRVLPGVLGNPVSPVEESFSGGTLEYPQFTRPAEFRGVRVPDVLVSGHHAEVRKWRLKEAFRRTLARRPDLLQDRAALGVEELKLLAEVEREQKEREDR